jgi:tetratricopeptide (TPR) repeat protein
MADELHNFRLMLLIIIIPILFSCATTQQKQGESRDAGFYINRGNDYFDKGQYDQAISDFNKALEINPNLALAYYIRGMSYYYKKEYDKAGDDFKKLLSLYFPENFVSNDLHHLYMVNLMVMQEPSLLKINTTNREVYRFLWLRTFHNPICIRLEITEKQVSIYSKRLNGKGGYEPGWLVEQKYRNLNEAEKQKLSELFSEVNYWEMSTEGGKLGFDGARWILEGNKNNKYHIVDRWTPHGGAYYNFCVYLIQLSKLEYNPKDLY